MLIRRNLKDEKCDLITLKREFPVAEIFNCGSATREKDICV